VEAIRSMSTSDANDATPAGQAESPYTGPASWTLDPGASSVSIASKAMWGLATVRGAFGQVSGSGEVFADGTAKGRLEIGAASIDTKNATRDTHLKSADFFDAGQHPQIVAELSAATREGDQAVTVDGTLTAAGKTRPLSFKAKITEATPQAVTLQADTAVDRHDFGMNWNRLGQVVGPTQVHVVARFVRSGAAS
jgi:polyisoprenoid-binding protein YceI